jgi:hypothetical protein
MIASTILTSLVALGLSAEPVAACSDVPPVAWTIETIGPDACDYCGGFRCVDAAVASDGAVVVAAAYRAAGFYSVEYEGGATYVREAGDWRRVANVTGTGCPRLRTNGTALRLAIRASDGTVAVYTRADGDWPVAFLPAVDGTFALRPDGQVRSVSAEPFGEALVVRDSDAVTDTVVPLPNGSLDGDQVALLALEVDDAGATHLVFQRLPHVLEYASDRSGSWTFDVIEPLEVGLLNAAWSPYSYYNDSAPRFVALAVDADGGAHVAYPLAPSRKLAYATNRTGSWQRTIADHGAPTGYAATLRLAANGTPFVIYHQIASGNLMLAAPGPDGWTVRTIDTKDRAGNGSALAQGPDGRWHAIFSRQVVYGTSASRKRPFLHAVSVPCAATLLERR